MSGKFVGRQSELSVLASHFQHPSASFLVIHGRRRIGKSRLVDEFGKNKTYFHFTGLAPDQNIDAQIQRNEFARKLASYFMLPGLKAEDWADLFTILAHQCRGKKVVLLFDEISWMGAGDPTFLSKLRNAWDREFKTNPHLMLILCGSVSSWIEKNILSSTGFLGRISHVLTLNQLSLHDCFTFWDENIASYEKIKYLAVTGGIPLYLEALNPKLSAEENIRQLCFTAGGLLVREFENIFSDLFTKRSRIYEKIVSALSQSALSIEQISKKINITQSGWLSEHLIDLEKSGFLTRDYTWHVESSTESKISHYRLSDNYLRFYLKYIKKNQAKIARNDFDFKSLAALPGWTMCMGFQFENLILKNRINVRKVLNIKPDEIIIDNPYFQQASKKAPGCQIDYMIQTKFNNLYVCEIKFHRSPIGTGIIQEVQQKIDALKKPKGFSCRPVLIHVNGVSDQVIDSDYFAKIISIDEL
jgi:uncharacterized protein